MSAQVWKPPAAIAVTPPARPETSTGMLLLIALDPLPSWPYALLPQHLTRPAPVSAQVCWPPGAIVLTPPPRPTTLTGTARFLRAPSPSWPSMFDPQHLTRPALVIAHVWR